MSLTQYKRWLNNILIKNANIIKQLALLKQKIKNLCEKI